MTPPPPAIPSHSNVKVDLWNAEWEGGGLKELNIRKKSHKVVTDYLNEMEKGSPPPQRLITFLLLLLPIQCSNNDRKPWPPSLCISRWSWGGGGGGNLKKAGGGGPI
jgi:hypothetical protein